jgi:hypothetical protein
VLELFPVLWFVAGDQQSWSVRTGRVVTSSSSPLTVGVWVSEPDQARSSVEREGLARIVMIGHPAIRPACDAGKPRAVSRDDQAQGAA